MSRRGEPEPGLVLEEAFVDDRQPAQDLLESHRLAHVDLRSSGTKWLAGRAR